MAFGPGDASRAPKSAPAVPTLTVRSLYQSSPSQGGHSRCLTSQSMMPCLIVMPSSLPLHMRRACVRSDIASDQYLPKCGPELQRQIKNAKNEGSHSWDWYESTPFSASKSQPKCAKYTFRYTCHLAKVFPGSLQRTRHPYYLRCSRF